MAKIYETREDLQREQLSQAASRANDGVGVNSAITGGGLGLLLLGLIKKKPDEPFIPESAGFLKRTWESIRHEPVDLRWMGGMIAAFGGIGMWMSHRRGAKINEAMEKLGPETVVLPAMEAPESDCAPCKLKAIQAKSLMQYAEKPADTKQVG